MPLHRSKNYLRNALAACNAAYRPNPLLQAYRHRDLKQYIQAGGRLLVFITYALIAIGSYLYYPHMTPGDKTLWILGCSLIATATTIPVILFQFSVFRRHYEIIASTSAVIALVKFGLTPQLFETQSAAMVESYSCFLAVIIIALALRLQICTLINVFLISTAIILISLFLFIEPSEINWAGLFYYYLSAALICIKIAYLQTELERENLEQDKIIKKQNENLTMIANQDSLTGLPNRRFFDTALDKEWARHQRSKKTLSVLYIDVDYFKKYNDHYGHLLGDQCLKTIAQGIGQALFRANDLAARYGGEEFVVLLPDIDAIGTEEVAARIIRSIAELNLAHEGSVELNRVSVSIGAAVFSPNRSNTLSEMLPKADEALYQAKNAGRNCFILYSDNAEPPFESPKALKESIEPNG